jgi:histone H1/5
MPPKKSTTAAPKKAAAPTASHGSFQDMVKDAIANLKERNGSSRQAIQKYIKANNSVGNLSDTAYKGHVNRAIAHGVEKGMFLQPKGK